MTIDLSKVEEVEDRALRRTILQFRMAAAGKLKGCIAEALAAQDEEDEAIMNRPHEEAMAARGLTIEAKPVRKPRKAVAQPLQRKSDSHESS